MAREIDQGYINVERVFGGYTNYVERAMEPSSIQRGSIVTVTAKSLESIAGLKD